MTEQQGPVTPKHFELLTNDDKQKIVQKLKEVPREQVEKFIYENKRKEWALTAEGTKWVVREMADKGEAIRLDGHPKVEHDLVDPEWMTCSVLGKRVKVDREGKCEVTLDSNIGSARSWIKQKLGTGDNAKIIPDDFWYTKLVSKATRNLQQSMIPNDFKKAIIVKLHEIKIGKSGGAQTQQSRPAGAGAPPAGQGSATPPAGQTSSAPPAGHGKGTQAPPAGQQQKPGQGAQSTPAGQTKSQQTTQKSQPAGNQAKQPPSLEAVQQGFRAVLVQFTGSEDKTTNQKVLKALTGKTMLTDLERELCLELGPLLRRAINKQVKWNGTTIHEIESGEQLWPKIEPQAEPESTPQHEEAPPPQEEPMF